MRVYLSILSGAMLLLTYGSFAALADELDTPSDIGAQMPDDLSFIDQHVSTAFDPKRSYIFFEPALGKVRQYPAATIAEEGKISDSETIDRRIVGAKVALDQIPETSTAVHFSFFILGEEGVFAATPVRSWPVDKLKENSQSVAELHGEIAELEAQKRENDLKILSLEDDLDILRQEASKIAGVEDIVELQREQRSVETMLKNSEKEKLRLERLVELGRELDDPQEIDAIRTDLLDQLKEAAQATAMADRLNARRKASALTVLKNKLASVRQTANLNPEALAQEVLRLRKVRREWEGRLNVSAPKLLQDF